MKLSECEKHEILKYYKDYQFEMMTDEELSKSWRPFGFMTRRFQSSNRVIRATYSNPSSDGTLIIHKVYE